MPPSTNDPRHPFKHMFPFGHTIRILDFYTKPRVEISGPGKAEDFNTFKEFSKELFPKLTVECSYNLTTERSTILLTLHRQHQTP